MSTDLRLALLHTFINTCPAYLKLDVNSLVPASADASFRRYFRVRGSGDNTFIVMDAPPEKEDCRPFLNVATLFSAAGVHVPAVLAQNLQQGFLLLDDFGSRTYLDELNPSNAPKLYGEAIDALVKLQANTRVEVLPLYDQALLMHELQLFPQWYLEKHLGVTLNAEQLTSLKLMFETIVKINLAEPKVYVHRDYHSRNLMLVNTNNPGIIDFQDAVIGPMSYDLVSLLRDAYIQWPEQLQLDWAIAFWTQARAAGLPVRADFGEFWRDFEIMGLQRHLKILGIFARLYHRDGKKAYLEDLPRVSYYARSVMERYKIFLPLLKILDTAESYVRPMGYSF
ncbi:MAG: phosphotransferase [Burkholderiaceae bacterium]|nr:phosphotransferase [Burkholderiaceae bacterium]